MQICFCFFHWLIYNAHHSESKHVMQLEGVGGGGWGTLASLRMAMCERVCYMCVCVWVVLC